MYIKQITIEGVENDVIIKRVADGAAVLSNGVRTEVRTDSDGEGRYALAYELARAIYGRSNDGRPNATNSMVHDILDEIERVAGC